MKRTPSDWTKLSEQPPVDLHIFKLRQLQAADPRDGTPHPRVLLDCPDWVNVIPVTKGAQIVMIRQFRFGIWSVTLELPGGMVDPGEDPATAVARELEEETGYRPGKLVSLGWCHPNPAIMNNRLHSFLALDCEQVHGGAPDAAEDIAIELYPRAKVEQFLRDGTISHSAVITAFSFEQLRGPKAGGG
ncbi:MAG: ADP-ribose pyrophosphatase [Myxococcaceae bacterium]|nr:ADP-ribose pyrophosphatase [Myxococcaceae bacterium]